MFTVRLAKRECRDEEKIERFLQEAQTGFLGLTDGLAPYVVPLNFVWLRERGAFYFHGAEEGRKIDLMARNKEACLTLSESFGTIPHPIPAKTDTAYMSVIAFGEMELVPELGEATEAMQALLDKYVPGYYQSPLAVSHVERYRSSMGSRTFIFKLVVRERTAKENAKE